MPRPLALLVVVPVLLAARDLMPVPSSLSPGTGTMAIDAGFRITLEGYREPRLESAAARTLARLARQTGIPMTGGASGASLAIECKGPGETVQSYHENERYTLDVAPGQARLTAETPVGVLRGLETFLQLVAARPAGFGVPAVHIEDSPRFVWRGLMIDSARHFLSLDLIKRNLDAMAAVKLNVFHWHLSDNQGFRVESKVYPELTGKGSDGLFYTQDQIRDVIAYARERGIRVIPEFDMPGHSTAWFVGYPDLASGPGPYSIERGWGIFDPAMDPTREETYAFLDPLIGEMAGLFSDAYFHIGGDEVNGKQWAANPRIQEYMRAHNLKNTEELQAVFIRRVVALVAKHGKRAVGWDEVLDPTLPKEAVVQSWRGQKGLAVAARQGYQVLLSNGYYLDLMQSAAYHYNNDPLGGEAASLNDAEKARVLGGEACEWSEMVTEENIEARIWPRMAVIAERLWSPVEVAALPSMYHRMEVQSRRLEWLGLQHRESSRKMLERMANYQPAAALALGALSTAVEPVKEYARHEFRKYTQSTPLNRMVDTAPADSVAARHFAALVHEYLTGKRENKVEISRMAELWRDQYAALQDTFKTSFLAAELEPVSKGVSELGSAALEALKYIASGKPAPAAWSANATKALEQSKAPKAELLVVIRDPVAQLVKAAASGK